jgi:hypothetical protein
VSESTAPTTLVRFYDYEPLSQAAMGMSKPSLASEGSARKLRFSGGATRH